MYGVDGPPRDPPADAAHFCTGPAEQKAVNLAENSSVALVTGCNNWDHGIDVVVEGIAVRVADIDLLDRLASAWRSKWTGEWNFDVTDEGFTHADGGKARVDRVEPHTVLAFGKGTFTHTRHRFTT